MMISVTVDCHGIWNVIIFSIIYLVTVTNFIKFEELSIFEPKVSKRQVSKSFNLFNFI